MIDANAMMNLRTMRGADGYLYIHDPYFDFPNATHVHIPQRGDRAARATLSGLADREERQALRRATRRLQRHTPTFGPRVPFYDPAGLAGLAMSQLESGAMGAATLALNFIPGIGPFLSAGAALAESLLGGGDPTPEWQLETQVMQMREQIALAHRQLGIADSFPIPLPDAKGPEHIPTLQAAVTEANGGPVSGNDWRQGLYTAIHNLQGELQQISQQSNNQQVVAQVLAALHQSPVLPGAAQPAPDPAGSLPQGQAPAQAAASTFGQEAAQVGPWALGGAALVVVLLLAMGSGAKKAAA